jgi:serine protease AprX
MTRTVFAAVLIFSLIHFPAMVIASEKIHPWLDKKSASGKEMEFLVTMRDSAELSPAALLKGKSEKGRFVYDRLRGAADSAQGQIREWLMAHGVEYRAFHIVNALLVKGDRKLMDALAARDDVARIEGNPEIRNIPPTPDASPAITSSTTGIEWNVSQVGAPDLWALGITGEGIVVGGSDTGCRWTHDALKEKYRGWNGTVADHNFNWHDAVHSGGGSCGTDSPVPCDDYGHGTHTMGTVVGDDGGVNRIGVAPGAKWIGCRNMSQGYGSPARYLECFEFFLAPYPIGGTPAQGDPSKAPDLTTNSWSCTVSEGCEPLTLETAVNNLKAAGIMTVVSAGNSGPSCGSVTTPPAIYGSAYTVGSTNSDYSISSFSSRGPAATTGLVKPDMVAPGSNIRSASNGGDSTYATMSGTSMAAPHVAGAVALIWSAAPAFRHDQNGTAALLNGSALKLPSVVGSNCGGDYSIGPNNDWGNGLLDIHSAYASASFALNVTLQGSGSGSVTSAPAGISCPGQCSHSFGSGAGITLTANPGEYSFFSGWTGACTGNSCVVTMDTNRNSVATFSLDMPHATRVDLPSESNYPSLSEAYAAAAPGAIISAWGITFQEELLCGDEKAVTLIGGYDRNYSANNGMTAVKGTVTVKRGRVTLERMVVR